MKIASVLVAFLAFAFVVPHAEAATLYMQSSTNELKRGDTMVVSVRLDPGEDECINAIDGVITYTENIQPVDISRGNSIFSLWVEEPVINRENRTITFAGGIPNGYCARIAGDPRLTNNIVDLLFQSPGLQIGSSESGNDVSIDFAPETNVYLNDGFGTVAPLQTFGADVVLTREAGGSIENPWQETVNADVLPPEQFSITLERTPNAFSNKYFITFNTTDKQSGIDHYEVMEEPLESLDLFAWGAADAPWVIAKSPYVLDDQSLNSTIRVRAIDKSGNEYIATYVPEESVRTISNERKVLIAVGVTGVLVLAGIMLGLFMLFIHLRNRKRTSINEDQDEIE